MRFNDNKNSAKYYTVTLPLLAIAIVFTMSPPSTEGAHITCDGAQLTQHQANPELNNTIDGTENADVLHGEGGDDIISGFENPAGTFDRLCGGTGRDDIRGGSGTDRIFGEDGNDVLDGGLAADRIEGGNGNDSINGQAGGDTLLGGNDDDTIWHGNDTDVDTIDGGPHVVEDKCNWGTEDNNTVTGCERFIT